jgi:DNA-binding CsgD family transcriptional regulator
VRFTNRALEKLLGHSCEDIRGTQCAGLLCGTDLHGRAFCGKDCPIPKAVAGGPGFSDFDLLVKRSDGERLLVNIGACYPPRELREQVNVFFSLRQVNPRRLLERIATAAGQEPVGESIRNRRRLTSRESEILRLTAQGMKTRQIADRLCISAQTVRSHFKNIYQKLGVHSRTQAVVFALRQGIN